jgi:hypothetical protein
MKIQFRMGQPQAKVHSTRFDYVPGSLSDEEGNPITAPWSKAFKPSFYLPRPVGEDSPHVTIIIDDEQPEQA